MTTADRSSRRRRRKGSNGSGGTYLRKDGRWEARITAVDAKTGLPCRMSFFARTEQEARQKMHQALADDSRGTLQATSGRKHNLSRWASEWLADIEDAVRPATLVRYRQALRPLLTDLGKYQLTKITPTQINGVLRRMRSNGRSPATANRSREVLRNCLKEAERRGLVQRNVASLARPMPVKPREETFLQPEQIPAFLQSAARHRHGPMWIVALATGLRLGELQGLRWSDIDLDEGTLVVRRSLRRIDRRWVESPPKSVQSRRVVGLPNMALEALRETRRRNDKERIEGGPTWSEEWPDLVFTTLSGEPPMPWVFARELHQAGWNLRFHDLRHSTASLLLAEHEPMRAIAEVLGHADPGFTARRYAHVAETMKKRSTAALDRALGWG